MGRVVGCLNDLSLVEVDTESAGFVAQDGAHGGSSFDSRDISDHSGCWGQDRDDATLRTKDPDSMDAGAQYSGSDALKLPGPQPDRDGP
jgi:hypothetical protein